MALRFSPSQNEAPRIVTGEPDTRRERSNGRKLNQEGSLSIGFRVVVVKISHSGIRFHASAILIPKPSFDCSNHTRHGVDGDGQTVLVGNTRVVTPDSALPERSLLPVNRNNQFVAVGVVFDIVDTSLVTLVADNKRTGCLNRRIGAGAYQILCETCCMNRRVVLAGAGSLGALGAGYAGYRVFAEAPSTPGSVTDVEFDASTEVGGDKGIEQGPAIDTLPLFLVSILSDAILRLGVDVDTLAP